MFRFFDKFAYLIVGLLLIAYGYHYVSKHHPTIPLPYKDQVFRLEQIVIYKIEEIITQQEKNLKEKTKTE